MSFVGLEDGTIGTQSTTWNLNKIGGVPDWMHQGVPRPQCKQCGRMLVLVVQLYCPLGDSCFHRTLYIFTCTNKPCLKSHEGWMVLRSQILDDSRMNKESLKATTENLFTTDDDWGMDADDWGEEDEDENILQIKDDWNTNSMQNKEQPDLGTVVSGMEKCQDINTLEPACEEKRTIGNFNSSSNDIENIESLRKMNLRDIEDDDKETENIVQPGDNGMFLPEALQSAMTVLDIKTNEGEGHTSPDSQILLCQPVTDQDRLTSFYISVIEEPSPFEEEEHARRLLRDYERTEGIKLEAMVEDHYYSGGNSGEKYEKDDIKHGDKVFHRFTKRVSACPQQCIRYQWNSEPIYISAPPPDVLHISKLKCRHCGGPTTFELQLMPALVNFLKFPQSNESVVEFGTVLVYTCLSSCWSDSDSTRLENIVVQQDPDCHLFK